MAKTNPFSASAMDPERCTPKTNATLVVVVVLAHKVSDQTG
jgi:hypothetical protein